jgi:histidinol phosphatase-like PHP family hydrolase
MNKITFSRPKPKKGYMCVDMHCHTEHSDGIASAEDVLKKIRKEKIGIAITDHTEISGCLEVFEKKKKSDLVIPGIEVMSKQGFDVLFYFYDLKTLKKFFEKEIKNNRLFIRRFRGRDLYKTKFSLEYILKLRKKYKCVVSLAHPYGYTIRAKPLDLEKYKHIFEYADAIEVINGGNNHDLNQKAVKLHSETDLSITGGSDSHSIFTYGTVFTYSKAKNVKEFLDNIKKKKNYVIGKELPPVILKSVSL